jgi:choline-sulfatase
VTGCRNVVLFVSDDHGAWATGAAGNPAVRTPTLDHLAATGVHMRNAFTPTPVCSPARACLLTGRLASQHGVHDYLATPQAAVNDRSWLAHETTLATLLADAGYQTALVGKWHLGQEETPQHGFGFWYSLTGDYPIDHGGTHRYSDHGRVHARSGYKTQIITDEAVRFLRTRDAAAPFFLVVGYTATHSPWRDHPERLVAPYRAMADLGVPHDETYPFGRQNLESTFPTRFDAREALAQYYAGVSQIDEGVGRLVDELEAQGVRDDTLVVYTSDHGLCCGHHGIWGKGNGTLPLNMLEESIRVPLIFNAPGTLFAGQRRGEFVDHLDTFATLLDLSGVAPPDDGRPFAGRSFLPLLTNAAPPPAWRTTQFGEYGPTRMIRTATHKLVRRDPGGPCELFDLRTDPRETRSLHDDPTYRPLVASLTAELEAHFAAYEDAERSGLRARDLPRHNDTEAWRTPGGGSPTM